MALSFSRILWNRNLHLTNFRCLYTPKSLNNNQCAPVCTPCNDKPKASHANRPLSPHLTIYKPQLTSMLSITHRATGIVLSSYGVILGIGTLFIPGGIPCLIQVISNCCFSSPTLFIGKALIAFPFTYHFVNGIRHLVWDLGKCLSIKDVYLTGWIALGVATVGALILAAL